MFAVTGSRSHNADRLVQAIFTAVKTRSSVHNVRAQQ